MPSNGMKLLVNIGLADMIDLFVIDPPWPKKKGGKRLARPNQGRELDYDVMPIGEIFTLLDKEILPLGNDPHMVFLWEIDEFLDASGQEMVSRGYRRHARIIWNKLNGVAPAFSVRYSHEYLSWYYKPKFTPVVESMRGKLTTIWEEKSREHSRKPDISYSNLELMFPNAAKMDVFSREHRDGWQQWGNEIDYFK